jgi:hypothetical protein
MCPLLFGFFLKCVDLHVPTYFYEFLYAKGMLKQKHVSANYLFVYFYVATVRSTWGLKECKNRKYFYDFFDAGIGK